MRFAERGLSPVKASLIGLVVLILASYFIFTKAIPFRHHYTIHAVVQSSNLLAPGSPVRIGGVDVGKVTGIGRYRNTSLGELTMQIDSSGRPIGTDATLKIRPRLFLEGNFYVDLSPGSPSAPELRDGGTLPLAQTSDPVQLDQLLDAFPADTRHELQSALQGLGVALDTTPTAAQDAQLDPAVRGLTGAQAINQTFDTSAASLRDSALDSDALTGPTRHQLAQVIAGFAHASAGLAAADGKLAGLVSEFDQTMQATAAEAGPLRQTVAELGPTARSANTAFSALDQAMPATARYSSDLARGLPELPATISAAYPWLDQAGPLFSTAELRGLLEQLAPASDDLAKLTHSERQFLPQIDAFDRCMTKVFLPTGNIVVNDGPLSSGVPNYQEFWYTMVGQSAEGQTSDGNGNLLRVGTPGGAVQVESGQTNYYGNEDTGFAMAPFPPLRTRPAYPNSVPPLRRDVPCYTQPIPDVNGPASIGPPDGANADGAPPPVPNDPALRIPTGRSGQ
jgi:phospholipid/cholesterol/gamma-HCH transport system substrate-binding protein